MKKRLLQLILPDALPDTVCLRQPELDLPAK